MGLLLMESGPKTDVVPYRRCVNENSSGESPSSEPHVRYMTQVVQSIRGMEARTRKKWEGLGWEFVSQAEGTVRTQMTFRKPKPTSPFAPVLSAVHQVWAKFRALTPKLQAQVAGGIAALVALGVIVAMVARGGEDAEPAADPKPAAESPSASTEPSLASDEATDEAPEPATSDPEPAEPTDEVPPVITVKNSPEFASMLKGGDCADSIGVFAEKHADETVKFRGSIRNVAPNGSEEDYLVSPGKFDVNSQRGPSFQFVGVTPEDLNFTDGSGPAFISEGEEFVFTAKVGEFDSDSCLFGLEPVSTTRE